MPERTVVSERFLEREDVPFVEVSYSDNTASLFRIFGNGSRSEIDFPASTRILLDSSETDETTALQLARELDAAFSDVTERKAKS